jgi:DNA polymerase-3 subunit delta'
MAVFHKNYPYGNVYDWLQAIGAENKQGNITAQECNDIMRKLNLKSFESGYKVLILWMPEYLGKEGNKLLKLIEEPPADTLFILVAESEAGILPTILSRCQLVKVPALEENAVAEALVTPCRCRPKKQKAWPRFPKAITAKPCTCCNMPMPIFMPCCATG